MFIAGRAKVDYLRAHAFVTEAARLPFDEDNEEADGFDNHACDSVLYPARFLCPAMSREPEKAPPEYGTAEWHAEQMRIEKEQRARDAVRAQRRVKR
jgi:hypothetical protein